MLRIKLFVFIFFFTLSACSTINKPDLYIQVVWHSMNPTLKNWKLYPAVKITSYKELKHLDVVVFKLYNTNRSYVKRLWIMPGDYFKLNFLQNWKILQIVVNWKYKINIRNYRDSKLYKMLLVWSHKTDRGKVETAQCGVFWDNVWHSIDSKKFGFISCQRIKYKLINK